MKTTRKTVFSGLAIAATTALLLTGCGAGQSKADACDLIKSKVESTTKDINSHIGDLQKDPKKAAESITTLSDKFSSAVDEVEQEDVKKVAKKASTALDKFSDDITSFAKDPASADSSAIMDSSSKVQKTFRDLGKVCS